MNPMLSKLNQSRVTNQIRPIKNAMNMARSVGNPQAMLNQMLSQNPNYQQVQQIIQQYGGDPKQAFYGMCQQMGVDPNEILNKLK